MDEKNISESLEEAVVEESLEDTIVNEAAKDTTVGESARATIVRESIRDSIIACIGIIFGVIVYFIVIPRTIIARVTFGHRMPGGAVVTNPAFMPRLWTIVIAATSVLVLIESLINLKSNSEDGKIKLEYYGKYFSRAKDVITGDVIVYLYVAGHLDLMILYAFLLGALGFIISTAICLTCALLLFGYRKVIPIIICNVVYIVTIYFVLTR